MCGIAGIHSRTGRSIPQLDQLADLLLLGIENRGRHSTGTLAMVKSGMYQMQKEATTAEAFIEMRKPLPKRSVTVLLHTRWATVGPRTVRNAHPVTSGTMAAIHNGTIYNADSLFRSNRLRRHADVDSEIIPALIGKVGWLNAGDAIRQFQGGAAFAAIDTKHPGEVILGRTEGYPLVYFVTDSLLIWASTREAIEDAWILTYGTDPVGTWVEMPEWTVARVNGDVTTMALFTPRKAKKAKRATTPPPVRQLEIDDEWHEFFDMPDPEEDERELQAQLAEQAVRDLVRYAGYSREEAWEAVMG